MDFSGSNHSSEGNHDTDDHPHQEEEPTRSLLHGQHPPSPSEWQGLNGDHNNLSLPNKIFPFEDLSSQSSTQPSCLDTSKQDEDLVPISGLLRREGPVASHDKADCDVNVGLPLESNFDRKSPSLQSALPQVAGVGNTETPVCYSGGITVPLYQCNICCTSFDEKSLSEHMNNEHSIPNTQDNLRKDVEDAVFNNDESNDGECSGDKNDFSRWYPNEMFDEKSIARFMLLNKCNICNEEFKLRSLLLEHDRDCHSGEGEKELKNRAMKCLFCSKSYFNEFRLLEHESCHPDKSEAIKCLNCGEIFENYVVLREHKKKSFEKTLCFLCHKEFPNDTCLAGHVKYHHNTVVEANGTNVTEIDDRLDDPEKDDFSSGTSTPFSKNRKLRCRFCPKKCSQKKNLLKHEMSHSDGTAAIRCNLCLELLENYKLLKIHKKQEDCQIMCSICSKCFPNQKCLSNHTRNSHSTCEEFEELSNNAEDPSNLESNQCEDENDGYSSEGSSVYLDALPRYTISDSGEPLRITIKQEKEEVYPDSPHSFTSSSVTPPTPPTPSPKGPPTPSPPPFISYVEESSEGSVVESSEDSSYAPQSKKNNVSLRRKSSLRTPRKVLPSDVYLESSSGESGNDDPEDQLYTPTVSTWKDSDEGEGDSDGNLGWRKTRNSQKKKNVLIDDESDDDPDWRKTRTAISSTKKRVTRGRGRGRKKPIEDFPRLVQPKVKRPRARGCGGQKAQDAAAALAEAVDEMESSMPELKVVIRPLKRSLGGSITKASVKRYSEVLASDKDYLINDKAEGNQEESKPDEIASLSETKKGRGINKCSVIKDVYNFDEQDQKDEEEAEDVVVKLEPHEIVEDDSPKSSFDRSGDASHSFEEGFDLSQDFRSVSTGEEMKEIRYVCKFCGRELQYRSHLLRHLRRVHNGEGVDEVMRRLMKCRFCSKQYSNELSLIHHEKLHDGTNKIKCSKCEEVFEDKNALRRHQRKTHWEHQPVECSVCKKQLADNTCLKAHMKHMHTAEERKVTVFTCETCGKQLHTKTAFQNHVASKCGTNLLFPCETCGKSFSFKGSLKAHQLLHTGVKSFLCRFCGKSFHQKGEMKRHERKHTGEKPFVCSVCGRAFAYRESLLGHSAVHTGIKPFPCKACGMRFSCSGNLVKHRRSNNCKASRELMDSSSPSAATVKVNSVSTAASSGVPAIMDSQTASSVGLAGMNVSCASSTDIQSAPVDQTQVNSSCASKAVPTVDIPNVNNLSSHRIEAQSGPTRVNNASSYLMDPQNFLSNSVRVSSTLTNALESSQMNSVSQMFSCPLPLRSTYSFQNSLGDRKLDSVIQNSSQEKRGTDMKSSMPELPASSVIKTNPVIAMKSMSSPSPLLMNVNLKSEPQEDFNQSYGMNYVTNRTSTQTGAVYETQDNNNLALHSAYGASSLTASYNENQYRQLNHNNINERHYAQFASDARIARNDALFDRESLIRQEMNRQVIERTVDRQASRLLDCFNGVQFGGIDRRNTIQSFSAASAVGHPSAYSNMHPSHFSNYTTAHTSSTAASHSSLYGGNAMVPGQVNFANFPSAGHMTMGQNNQVPAHSVSHPATHMGHLGAFLGHFGHSPVHPSNSFPRYSLSHNMSSPPHPTFPSNHRL